MRIPTATLLLLLFGLICWHAGADLTNPVCVYKSFPIFAGGSRDEFVNTMEYDTTTDYILVGGITQSSDFAPAENNHGFVYALDPQGHWMWGNFFYNVSYAVSSVDGIKMSSDKSHLNILGQANSKPIIMNLNKENGQIERFITINPVESYSTTPTYYTNAGIYEDMSDPTDGKAYFYVAFAMNSNYDLHILRIQSADVKIDWHMQYVTTTTSNTNLPFN